MSKYKTLLFDIDDTLLDFKAAEKSALAKLFDEVGIPFTEELNETYQEVNHGLWQQFEKGEIDRDQVLNGRFSRLFERFDKVVDGEVYEQKYRNYLDEGHQLIPGALELIKDLAQQYDLYVVTNGVSKTQYRRLTESGLLPYFKDIFVSEDTGYQKPMPEYFDYVFVRIPNFDRSTTLLIGDTLTSDIQGSVNVGLDSCWYNPQGKTNPLVITPTYELSELAEIYQVLEN